MVNGKGTLREAIMAANHDAAVDACPAASGADTIALPPGTYTPSLTGSGDFDGSTGDLDLLTSMTITSSGAQATIIDGNHSDRVFDGDPTLTVAVDVTFTGLTVQNGAVTNSNGMWDMDDCCGGIRNYETLTLTHGIISHNCAEVNGTGIGNIGPCPCSPTGPGARAICPFRTPPLIITAPPIQNSTISGNTTTGYAGGLVVDHNASLALNNVTITDYTANFDQSADGSGGGFTLKPGSILTITIRRRPITQD